MAKAPRTPKRRKPTRKQQKQSKRKQLSTDTSRLPEAKALSAPSSPSSSPKVIYMSDLIHQLMDHRRETFYEPMFKELFQTYDDKELVQDFQTLVEERYAAQQKQNIHEITHGINYQQSYSAKLQLVHFFQLYANKMLTDYFQFYDENEEYCFSLNWHKERYQSFEGFFNQLKSSLGRNEDHKQQVNGFNENLQNYSEEFYFILDEINNRKGNGIAPQVYDQFFQELQDTIENFYLQRIDWIQDVNNKFDKLKLSNSSLVQEFNNLPLQPPDAATTESNKTIQIFESFLSDDLIKYTLLWQIDTTMLYPLILNVLLKYSSSNMHFFCGVLFKLFVDICYKEETKFFIEDMKEIKAKRLEAQR